MTFLASLLKPAREALGSAYRYALTFALGATALIGITSCARGDSSSSLKVDLAHLGEGDSLLYVLRIGEGVQWRDTIDLQGEKTIELSLDTSKVRSVLLSADSSRWISLYKYSLGKWTEQKPDMTEALDTISIHNLYGRDSQGDYKSLSSLYSQGLTVVAFSDPDLKTLSKREQDSLKKQLGQDSLQFAYFMLTLSDSTALSRLKRDTLQKGLTYSDSLGVVSNARQHFGISRETSARLFTIDTLGTIQPLK